MIDIMVFFGDDLIFWSVEFLCRVRHACRASQARHAEPAPFQSSKSSNHDTKKLQINLEIAHSSKIKNLLNLLNLLNLIAMLFDGI